jgi:hypothetical protein
MAEPPRTYTEYFTLETSDPYQGVYGPVLREYRTEFAAPNHMALTDMAARADVCQPMAFIALIRDHAEEAGRSLMVHGVHKYPSTVGIPSEWDDKIYAFAGDVDDGDITTIAFEDDCFTKTRGELYTNVPSSYNRMDELWGAEPDDELLGPFEDEDALIGASRTRHIMYVPPKYVPIIANRRLSPKELWFELVGTIRADGAEEDCEELVKWCMLAAIREDDTLPSASLMTAPMIPLSDRRLKTHRKWLLHQQLPALRREQPATGATAGTEQLVNFVGQMVNEHKEARLQAQERSDLARGPKLPSTYWGVEACRVLCTLCNVGSEMELPQLWLSLADAGKRDRLAMEMVITDIARQKGQVELAPIVTPELVKRLIGLRFDGDNVEDLGVGMQPFAITISDYTSTTGEVLAIQARQRAEEYDLIADGSITTSLADAKALRGAGKASLVRDFAHARALLQAQNILHHAMLGPEHVLTREFQGFVTAYSNRELYYQGRLTLAASPLLGPATLLRYVQLRLVHWYREFHVDGALPDQPPDLKGMLRKLSYGDDSWLPRIPLSYAQAITGSGTGGGGGPKGRPKVGGGSVVSDLTTPTTAESNSSGSSATRTPKARHLVYNQPGVNSIFAKFAAKIQNIKIAEAIATAGSDPPLLVRDGNSTPMCCVWHLKGQCWANCPRAADHVPHHEEEDKRLLAWCEKAYI